MAKKAPSGWATSPDNSPGKGAVWTKDQQTKWDSEASARAAATKDKVAATKARIQKKQDDKKADKLQKAKDTGVYGKAGTSAKSKQKADRKAAAKKELEKRAQQNQSFIPIPSTLSDLEEEDRTQLLEELVLEETMSLEESQELQAIMALDDAGIKAEINRKGQVVIKKKDKKKAHKALEKSFKKGGWPPLKLEDVETIGDVLDQIVEDSELEEASSKKARNKAADEINKIADKGGAEAPTLFSLASKIRKGTHSTTGLKLSKEVASILKKHGIKEEKRPRTAYEVVSEARNRASENKPKWESEDSESRVS